MKDDQIKKKIEKMLDDYGQRQITIEKLYGSKSE